MVSKPASLPEAILNSFYNVTRNLICWCIVLSLRKPLNGNSSDSYKVISSSWWTTSLTPSFFRLSRTLELYELEYNLCHLLMKQDLSSFFNEHFECFHISVLRIFIKQNSHGKYDNIYCLGYLKTAKLCLVLRTLVL